MNAEGERDELFDLVLRASPTQRKELSIVLLAAYRVELTRALRDLVRKGRDAALSRIMTLAGLIVTAAALAHLDGVKRAADQLETDAASLYIGEPNNGDVISSGVDLVEEILACTPPRELVDKRRLN